ncbi:MAG: hypothetical protein AAF870_05310, partial [Pseudomonadota bacterium]
MNISDGAGVARRAILGRVAPTHNLRAKRFYTIRTASSVCVATSRLASNRKSALALCDKYSAAMTF